MSDQSHAPEIEPEANHRVSIQLGGITVHTLHFPTRRDAEAFARSFGGPAVEAPNEPVETARRRGPRRASRRS